MATWKTEINMTPAEIFEGLIQKNRLLGQKNSEYLQLAEKRAEAERDYSISVAEYTLKYKEDYAATLIPKLVSGNKVVAGLKFKFDVALAIEKACLESIKDIRSAIDTYRSLLTWLRAEMTGQT